MYPHPGFQKQIASPIGLAASRGNSVLTFRENLSIP